MEYSTDQTKIFDTYKAGKNIFITGPGGSGKTTIIRQIASHAKEAGIELQVCALTGCAAILLKCGAKTLHSWAGVGIAKGTIKEVVEKVLKNRHRRKNWNKVKTLVIDEVSMLSLKLFAILDLIGKTIKKSVKPFGGIQIICSGDFYQLPPIGDADDEMSAKFCFESDDWNSTFDLQIELKTIFRQSNETFSKILNEIRVGKIRKSSCELLKTYIRKPDENNPIKPPLILSRRSCVDALNLKEFNKLDGIVHKYNLTENKVLNDTPENAKLKEILSCADIDNELEYLKKNISVEKSLLLKIGTQVMCSVNIDLESENPIANGSQGIILDFVNDMPLIQFNNGDKRVIGLHTWNSETISGIGIIQLPLIYSWAITIHKAQGTTLESAQIDIGNNIFECGQTYVALSRIKSLDGLYLIAFNPQKIKIYKKVEEFYNMLKIKE